MPRSPKQPDANAPALVQLGWSLRQRREHDALERVHVAEALRYSEEVVKKVELGTYHADIRHYVSRWQEVYGLDDELRSLWQQVLSEREPEDGMRRAPFLKGLLAGGAAMVLDHGVLGSGRSRSIDSTVASLKGITGHYRRLDAHTPAAELVKPTLAHLSLIAGLFERQPDGSDRMALAAAASEAAGLAGWLATDLARPAVAYKHYRTALSFATKAKAPALRAYMVGTLASWTAETGNGRDALRLVDAAAPFAAMAAPTARAWLLAIKATAHSAQGDERAARAALDEAESLTLQESPPQWPWVYPFDRAKIDQYRAVCLTRLGLDRLAAPMLDRAIQSLPADALKRRATLVTDLAGVVITTGDIDQAATLIGEAFDLAVSTGSRRTIARVRDLRHKLMPWERARSVRALDRRLLGPFLRQP